MFKTYVINSPSTTKIVMVKGTTILSEEVAGEDTNIPVNSEVFIADDPDRPVHRIRVLTFDKNNTNKENVYSRIVEYEGTTNFVYTIGETANSYLAIIASRKIFASIHKLLSPSAIYPFDFAVVWGIQKRLKVPVVSVRSNLIYFISRDTVVVSVVKDDITKYITEDTVAIDEDAANEFPNLKVVHPKRRFTVSKKFGKPVSQQALDLEFAIGFPYDLNQSLIKVVKKEPFWSLPEVKYGTSILLAILVGYGISFSLNLFGSYIIHPHVETVHMTVPSEIKLNNVMKLQDIIYKKGMPYTLYEFYNGNNKVGYFVNKDIAVSFVKKHPSLTLYAVTYYKDGTVKKEPIPIKKEGKNGK